MLLDKRTFESLKVYEQTPRSSPRSLCFTRLLALSYLTFHFPPKTVIFFISVSYIYYID